MRKSLLFVALVLVFAPQLSWSQAAKTQSARIPYLSYTDAQPILRSLNQVLPSELRNKSQEDLASAWPAWVARYDAEIRSRLIQGDEDTVVNFLLFGASFTKQPRITAKELAQWEQQVQSGGSSDKPAQIFQTRTDDLIRALGSPGANERLLFIRKFLEKKGYRPTAAADHKRIKEFLLESLSRVLIEQKGYAKTLEVARRFGDPSEVFAERSKLFHDRGLSLDTSLMPDYAIEESLKALAEKKLLTPGSVQRVAIIGPGLDFTDKQEGYDFYPQQTLQPFGVADSLLRLGLGQAKTLRTTILDLSPRVLDHVAQARQRAQAGSGYIINLPYDPQLKWKPELIRYWERFGDQVGAPTQAVSAPDALGGMKIRAVRVRPEFAAKITGADVNIVLQHQELPEDQKFDLMIATNILVYYDEFGQCLALANIEQMLRPGGLLLSNNALLELPSSQMRSVGYLSVAYSDRPDDGDHIVWYQRR